MFKKLAQKIKVLVFRVQKLDPNSPMAKAQAKLIDDIADVAEDAAKDIAESAKKEVGEAVQEVKKKAAKKAPAKKAAAKKPTK
jgi:hypothetical protein